MMTTTEKPHAKEEVISWIFEILDRKGWTGTELAHKSELAPSTILRLLNDKKHHFTPSLKTLKKIARGANTDIPGSILKSLDTPGQRPEAADQAAPATRGTSLAVPQAVAALAGSRRQMVKVRQISTLPAALQPKNEQDIMVACPAQLEGDSTVFAFYMPEATYEPFVKVGSLCFASKRRDPYAGDTLVITRKDGKSMVRVLVEINEAGLVLSKNLPAKTDETIEFDDIQDIAIVMMISL